MKKHDTFKTTPAKKKKIMIADDDPAILDVLSIILEDAGYEVETSPGGERARSIQENFPDLFLLDIWMSGLNGKDICAHLKSQKNTKHIPVILISANRDIKSIAKEYGADDFITKPFELEELIKKVAKYT